MRWLTLSVLVTMLVAACSAFDSAPGAEADASADAGPLGDADAPGDGAAPRDAAVRPDGGPLIDCKATSCSSGEGSRCTDESCGNDIDPPKPASDGGAVTLVASNCNATALVDGYAYVERTLAVAGRAVAELSVRVLSVAGDATVMTIDPGAPELVVRLDVATTTALFCVGGACKPVVREDVVGARVVLRVGPDAATLVAGCKTLATEPLSAPFVSSGGAIIARVGVSDTANGGTVEFNGIVFAAEPAPAP